ncbi:MAG: dUTP diphosphatase [Armatimonadetes bacterium]|nr:dUTP diphosphatase [Armatimonadota bacterium]
MSDITVYVEQLPDSRDLPPPQYMTEHAAGLDLRAAVKETLTLAPGQFSLVPTGIRLAIAPGYEGQVRPRSGLAAKHGVTLVNAPGTIDADYRGEVCVVLINHGGEAFEVNRGDRIAQLVIAPVTRARLEFTDGLESTGRGAGGFGHTGK